MRNQQAPIPRENVFFPEIEPLCSHSPASAPYLPGKGNMCILAAGRGPATSPHLQDSAPSHPESQQDCTTRDKTLIAQPVFAPEKKERPFKRQAGDLAPKAELGFCAYPEKRLRSSSFTCRPTYSSAETGNDVSDKRVRSSSFSFLTAFPPNQPALKNNVFMPPTLLQEPPAQCNTDSGLHSWTVMKPATLQPPQVTGCKDAEETKAGTGVTACQHEHEAVPEKDSAVVNNAEHAKFPTGSAYILPMETRMQPFEQMFVPHKYKADFVFGENMEKRVMIPKRPTQSSAPQCKRESTLSRGSCNRNWPYQKHRSHKSLIESAAAYTSRPRLKYELDQVEVITGEESERNVLQVNCKLFLFNKENQSWTERGRGYLRLNDLASSGGGPFRSRIVMRNHGNLKLILNSQIFEEMKLERASRKSLRITATDLADNRLKIFVLQASVKDAGRLYAAIHHRLIALRHYRAPKQEQSIPNTDAETECHLQLHSSDSEDDEDDEDDEMLLYPSKMSDHHQWIRRQPVLYS